MATKMIVLTLVVMVVSAMADLGGRPGWEAGLGGLRGQGNWGRVVSVQTHGNRGQIIPAANIIKGPGLGRIVGPGRVIVQNPGLGGSRVVLGGNIIGGRGGLRQDILGGKLIPARGY